MPEGLNDTLLDIGSAAMQAVATHGQLYTAEPNAAGTTNASAAGRQALTWVTAANGDMIITADAAFTGGAASGRARTSGCGRLAPGAPSTATSSSTATRPSTPRASTP